MEIRQNPSLLSVEGDGDSNPGGGGDGDNGGAAPWFNQFEAFKTSDPQVWESLSKTTEKDLPSFVHSAVNHQKMIGRSIVPPGQNAKPEEIAAFKQKIYGTGVFKAPPESADKYAVERPEDIPENLWNQELVGKLRDVAHRHGLSQDAVNELIALDKERFTGMTQAYQLDRQEAQSRLEARAAQEGLSQQEVMAYGGAWLKKNVSEQQLAILESTGLANHPDLAWIIAKAGRDSGEDISHADGRSSPQAEAEFQEARRIQTDANHPDHKRWRAGDPAVQAKIDEAYRKKYGTGDMQVSGGES